MRGAGRAVFAAILLVIAGTLNIIYGIGAISDANFYANNTHYVFSSLHTWGWITLILGVIQLTAGFSLFGGGAFPFWSLGIFALCVIVIHGLVVYGEPEQV